MCLFWNTLLCAKVDRPRQGEQHQTPENKMEQLQ